jgi:hypothetical protein
VPGVEAARSIAPVVALMLRPVVELNVPPIVPVIVAVGLVPVWQKGEPLKLKAAVVWGLMVTVVVAVAAAQPPEAATVFVTVKVPAVLADRSMTPVEGFITRPVVDENVPAVAPAASTGAGLVPPMQKDMLAKEKPAFCESVIVTDWVLELGQEPPTL